MENRVKLIQRAAAGVLLSLAFALVAAPQEKPLTKDQVLGLVKNQLGDETGAAAIRKRGVDFQPTEDFLEALRNAGATAVFIEALRKAAPPPAETTKPEKSLDIFAVFDLLLNQVSGNRVAQLVKERGLIDPASPDEIGALKDLGASDEVVDAVRRAPTAHVEDWEKYNEIYAKVVVRHARLAEADYRARLQHDPRNRSLMFVLAYALDSQGKHDEAATLCRKWASRYPDDWLAYKTLGIVLVSPRPYVGDLLYNAQSVSALQKTVRLNPNDAESHWYFGGELEDKVDEQDQDNKTVAEQDRNVAEEEYCKAASIDPKTYPHDCGARHNN